MSVPTQRACCMAGRAFFKGNFRNKAQVSFALRCQHKLRRQKPWRGHRLTPMHTPAHPSSLWQSTLSHPIPCYQSGLTHFITSVPHENQLQPK